MFQKQAIKEAIYAQLQALLRQKIEQLNSLLASLEESRNGETKSSVGDKYETGRAMVQIEIGNTDAQLQNALGLQKTLDSIGLETCTEAILGACVRSNTGVYFLSIGLGKIKIEQDVYFAISMASPIGKAFLGKKTGEIAVFQGRNFVIEDVW